MTLQEFNKNYIYQSDKDKFNRKEVWEVIQPLDGKYRGDCESYMLTILELGLIDEDTKLYYCKIQGGGHCIGILNGLVIDCNAKQWISIDKYTDIYDMTDLRDYLYIEILWKRMTTKLFGYVPFIR